MKYFKDLMEHNDNKRHQRFDGVTIYCYTKSSGCDILMIFQKKKNKKKTHTDPTELNSNQLETLIINIEYLSLIVQGKKKQILY